MFAVFLLRVKPASHKAKPGCIQNTSIAASNIHTVSSDNPISFIILFFFTLKIIFNLIRRVANPGLLFVTQHCVAMFTSAD